MDSYKETFHHASEFLFSKLDKSNKFEEVLNLNFKGEDTNFIRFNKSRVRQISGVEQASLELELIVGNKKAIREVTISLNGDSNDLLLSNVLSELQKEVRQLPDDPFITPLKNEGESDVQNTGSVPTPNEFIDLLASTMGEADLAGYLTSGSGHRGNANSLGQKHWFSSQSFFFDYSLYTAKEKAVKGTYAGTHFKRDEFEAVINESMAALKVMDRPQVEVKPGEYKVYLAPAATHEIVDMLGWHALSGGAYQRGECPLADLYDGKREFSPLMTLKENFNLGLSPAFNGWGEVSESQLPLVTKGKMDNFLVSRETEKEYGMKSNKASGSEGPRALQMISGSLSREEILKEIGTGLYLSNLHYLNWSDKPKGRVTGMTRFGCLWVENGEIVGPIKDLRFDESLYKIFGTGLKGVTNFSQVFMSTSTYGDRSLGGSDVPGLMVEGFKFTL